MSKFLYRVLIFTSISIALMFILNALVESGLKDTELRLFKSWNRILKGNINAGIVVLGNSRAYRHYNPAVIDSITGEATWNLGMDAGSFNNQDMKYGIYRMHNTKPRCIIIDVNYYSLEPSDLTYERNQFLPYLNDASFRNELIDNAFPRSYRYIPLIRYFGFPNEITVSLAESLHIRHFCDNEVNGFLSTPEKWNVNEFDALIRKKATIKMPVDNQIRKEFISFIKQRTNEGINVLLVWSPLNKEALKVFTDNLNDRMFFKHIADSMNVCFLDYSDDEICVNNSYFSNVTHLNETGARIFSQKLSREINELSIPRSLNEEKKGE